MSAAALTSRDGRPPLFAGYSPTPGTWDELFESVGRVRPDLRSRLAALLAARPDELSRAQALAERSLLNQGVTFSVYSDRRGGEKIFPFCLVPRTVAASDWRRVEHGIEQRIRALEAFLDDVYGRQRILASGRVPKEVILGAKHYLPQLHGIRPPRGVRIHVAGIDLIRSPDGVFRVLEDNLRTPSGVSYVMENRAVTKRVFPTIFAAAGVRSVDHYPARLAEALRASAPVSDPLTVVLTPGPYNSAYFEHTFLARNMGVELVQGSDLCVEDDKVYLRTTLGLRQVHVIYRRIDDDFLDPEALRKDSLLGTPGLLRAYAKGNVTIANAPGNGVADDKAVCALVPDMIRFYLSEDPILADVPTYVCARDSDRRYVLEHLHELVVKAVDEAGGYGMLMGPESTAAEREEFRRRIEAEPRKYVAQHRIELSTCPTWEPSRNGIVPRRVDLRPFVLTGPEGSWVLPGGLTRVALREGSYVVNSSQGGGSKDTWVLRGGGVIARTADHCFWLGRYIERTESMARVLQVTESLALDAELPPRRSWHPVVIVSGQESDYVTRFGLGALGDAEVVQRYLALDEENPVSMRRSIGAARENARSIREVLSLDVWQAINELHVFLGSDEAPAMYEQDRYALYARVQRTTQLTLGLLRSTMLHDPPLDFVWLGVLLERVSQTARLLDVQYHALLAEGAPHQVLETALWLSLLRACSGSEAFMKRNRGLVTGTAVAAFLVMEPRFPRSVRYCVTSARERLASICDGGSLPTRVALARATALEQAVSKLTADELRGARVHQTLTFVVDETHAVCEAIESELFGPGSLTPASQFQSQ